MFILAFLGFLRGTEISTTSNFKPSAQPTFSDLSVLDSETIAYFIKQSKTDQAKRGHFIYIYNLHSPIQLYQALLAYLHFRTSHAKSSSDQSSLTTETALPLAFDSSKLFCSHLASRRPLFQPFLLQQQPPKKAYLSLRSKRSASCHQRPSKFTSGQGIPSSEKPTGPSSRKSFSNNLSTTDQASSVLHQPVSQQ